MTLPRRLDSRRLESCLHQRITKGMESLKEDNVKSQSCHSGTRKCWSTLSKIVTLWKSSLVHKLRNRIQLYSTLTALLLLFAHSSQIITFKGLHSCIGRIKDYKPDSRAGEKKNNCAKLSHYSYSVGRFQRASPYRIANICLPSRGDQCKISSFYELILTKYHTWTVLQNQRTLCSLLSSCVSKALANSQGDAPGKIWGPSFSIRNIPSCQTFR